MGNSYLDGSHVKKHTRTEKTNNKYLLEENDYFNLKVMNFLTVAKIYTVSRDGALFVWSCNKDIDELEMKDKNNEDSGLKTFLKILYKYCVLPIELKTTPRKNARAHLPFIILNIFLYLSK